MMSATTILKNILTIAMLLPGTVIAGTGDHGGGAWVCRNAETGEVESAEAYDKYIGGKYYFGSRKFLYEFENWEGNVEEQVLRAAQALKVIPEIHEEFLFEKRIVEILKRDVHRDGEPLRFVTIPDYTPKQDSLNDGCAEETIARFHTGKFLRDWYLEINEDVYDSEFYTETDRAVTDTHEIIGSLMRRNVKFISADLVNEITAAMFSSNRDEELFRSLLKRHILKEETAYKGSFIVRIPESDLDKPVFLQWGANNDSIGYEITTLWQNNDKKARWEDKFNPDNASIIKLYNRVYLEREENVPVETIKKAFATDRFDWTEWRLVGESARDLISNPSSRMLMQIRTELVNAIETGSMKARLKIGDIVYETPVVETSYPGNSFPINIFMQLRTDPL